MLYLILSIICSVSVGVIFKVARRYNVAVSQVVAWNYVFALMLCYAVFAPDLTVVTIQSPWQFLVPLAILLPCIFLFLAASIKHMGIVKTDAAQRFSLFIPILAAYFIFGETFNNYKIIGLLIAIPALLFILFKKTENQNRNWIYPAIVLLGFGIIDILFKQILQLATLSYTTALFVVFCIALIVSVIIASVEIIRGKTKFEGVNFLAGMLVGILNFGNILFYLMAHKAFAGNPSTVFAGMNLGVIILGSLTGILAFKEKLTRLNYLGLALALVAIVFITLSQIYK